MLSKKILAFSAVVVLLIFTFSVSVFAQGTDDGTLSVTTKNSKQYIGIAKSDFCTEYVSANGVNDKFYRYTSADVNSNNITDICDLVALNNAILGNGKGTDFNFDSVLDNKDLIIVRQFILGATDFEIK